MVEDIYLHGVTFLRLQSPLPPLLSRGKGAASGSAKQKGGPVSRVSVHVAAGSSSASVN